MRRIISLRGMIWLCRIWTMIDRRWLLGVSMMFRRRQMGIAILRRVGRCMTWCVLDSPSAVTHIMRIRRAGARRSSGRLVFVTRTLRTLVRRATSTFGIRWSLIGVRTTTGFSFGAISFQRSRNGGYVNRFSKPIVEPVGQLPVCLFRVSFGVTAQLGGFL